MVNSKGRPHRGGPVLALVLLLAAGQAAAAWFEARVSADGQPVEGAVVSLHGSVPARAGQAVMDQRNTAFEPGVLVIQAGTAVSFPNSDTVRHQVYSFSPAKPFELPLYSGTPPEPVVFEKPGVVVVGCNIHDWMIGWIVVLDTPLYARTDAAGRARIEAPAGDYRLQAWHSRLEGGPVEVAVAVPGEVAQVALRLGPPPPERRGNERLRALQERLRSLRKDD